MSNNYQIFMLCPTCQGIVFTLITVRLSLHTSTSDPTTQHPGTQLKFVSTPGMTTDRGFATTIDQSTCTDFSKQAVSVDAHSFVSDGCGDVGVSEDNLSDSIDDTLLEYVLRDENVEMERDTLPGTAV